MSILMGFGGAIYRSVLQWNVMPAKRPYSKSHVTVTIVGKLKGGGGSHSF